MQSNEFYEALQKIKEDFFKSRKKNLETVTELEEYITKLMVFRSKRSKSLKSLKGIF